jgi:hypothetical protein
MFCIFNLRPISQAGRRGFDCPLPLHPFKDLHRPFSKACSTCYPCSIVKSHWSRLVRRTRPSHRAGRGAPPGTLPLIRLCTWALEQRHDIGFVHEGQDVEIKSTPLTLPATGSFTARCSRSHATPSCARNARVSPTTSTAPALNCKDSEPESTSWSTPPTFHRTKRRCR